MHDVGSFFFQHYLFKSVFILLPKGGDVRFLRFLKSVRENDRERPLERNTLDRRGNHNPSTQKGRFSPGDDPGRISTGKEVISISEEESLPFL
jgi:hypothetical protein